MHGSQATLPATHVVILWHHNLTLPLIPTRRAKPVSLLQNFRLENDDHHDMQHLQVHVWCSRLRNSLFKPEDHPAEAKDQTLATSPLKDGVKNTILEDKHTE
jgi:hypothetical protein